MSPNFLYSESNLLNIDTNDVNQLAAATDLDWEIIKRPAIYVGLNDEPKISNKHFILKKQGNNLEELAIVGKDHKPTQPKDILKSFIKLSQHLSLRIVAAGHTRGGKFIYAIGALGEYREIKNVGFSKYLFISTTNDGNGKTKITPISFNLETSTQLTQSTVPKQNSNSYTLSHHYEFDVYEATSQIEAKMTGEWDGYFDNLEKLAEVPIEQYHVDSFHHTIFQRFNLGNESTKRKYDVVMYELNECFTKTNKLLSLQAQWTLLSLLLSFMNYIDNVKHRKGGISSKIHAINFGCDEVSKRTAFYEVCKIYSEILHEK